MNAVVKSIGAQMPYGLRPQSMTELMQFAQLAAKSGLMPKDYVGKPENIVIAVQMGSELGLAPMQALQNISIINGRPSVWGDAMLGLVRASGLCDSLSETLAGAGDDETATCTLMRRGDPNPIVGTFSVSDAKKANLFGKPGPWQQYPKRMMKLRARGFALRDGFPDVLRGLISTEEAQDIPADAPPPHRGATIEHRAEPPAQPRLAEALGDAIPETSEPVRPFGLYLRDKLAAATTPHEVAALRLDPRIAPFLTSGPPDAVAHAVALIEARIEVLMPAMTEGPPPVEGEPIADDDLSGGI